MKVYSGVRKDVNKGEYEATVNYIDELSRAVSGFYVHSPRTTSYNGSVVPDLGVVQPLYAKYQKVKEAVEAFGEELRIERERLTKEAGYRTPIELEELLACLPPTVRFTTEPEQTHDSIRWNISVKHQELPAHANYAGKQDNELMGLVRQDPKAQVEEKKMEAWFAKYTALGYRVSISINKVTKASCLGSFRVFLHP